MAGDRPLAVVTGASSGIGRAFAFHLAAQGYDLLLTARREERLRTTAEALRATYGVAADYVVADLDDPASPARIAARAGPTQMLVNVAGYTVPGPFLAAAWPRHRDFLQTLVAAPCELAHHLVPGMVERGRGYVVNVSSTEGLRPASSNNMLYVPAKSFQIQFSRALHDEVRRRGVHVTALCPGFTKSELHDVPGDRTWGGDLPFFVWMKAEDVAAEGYRAVMRNKTVHVPGLLNKSFALMWHHLPTSIAPWVRYLQLNGLYRLGRIMGRLGLNGRAARTR